MKRLKRRDFLKQSAGTTVGLGAAPLLLHCGDEKAPAVPITAEVAAQRGHDLESQTRNALEAIGGMSSVVAPGETVFIKPNMVTLPFGAYGNRITNGECTKPEIIIAVAEACLEAGAGEVIIGDGSQMPTFDWSYATSIDGSTDIVLEVERLNAVYDDRVRLVCLESDSPEWIEIPSHTMGNILISSLVASADRVISIPVAKTHSWSQLSLSLKNFVGITSIERYGTRMPAGYWDRGTGLDHGSPAAIAAIFLDIVGAIAPDLAVIDMSIGVEGNGPSVGSAWGQTVDMKSRLGSWVVLASTDLVAADATAARIMDHDPAGIDQLRMARSRGLGTVDAAAIAILGEQLSKLKVSWTKAQRQNRAARNTRCPYGIVTRAS